MALALEIQKAGWKGAYVKEYMAVGEVPETIRNAFMQARFSVMQLAALLSCSCAASLRGLPAWEMHGLCSCCAHKTSCRALTQAQCSLEPQIPCVTPSCTR